MMRVGSAMSEARTRQSAISDTPRILLIDMTRIGDATATGELKANLFADWPRDALMQLYAAGGGLGMFQNDHTQTLPAAANAAIDTIEKLARQFAPDIILYRPAPKTTDLHRAAMAIIDRLQIPLATWIMDDWPTAFAAEDPPAAAALVRDWRALLACSAERLSISEVMSEAFQQRYGCAFTAIANGVDPADWSFPMRPDDGVVKVRYAGSLAENMTLASIVNVARAVEVLAGEGVNIVFEIKTRDLWRRIAEPQLKDLKQTTFIVADLTPVDYRAWLADADICVIAYNFDETSKRYIQYSVANKMPECLASGAALLAVGPRDVATMAALAEHNVGVCVTQEGVGAIANAVRALAASPTQRRALGEKGREIAFQHFNVFTARQSLARVLSAATRGPAPSLGDVSEEARADGAHVDETAVIARLLSNRKGRRHMMIDVGAHVGTSAAYFHRLGWSAHCFEPDPKNRARLKERFAGVDSVSIDRRAVSDTPQQGVSFFTSQESTGISGLSAFRDTHEETGSVDVTTVKDIAAERGIKAIDFLKIDVEGFDFSVLKGVAWDDLRPDVIECEFEDAKTRPMGHTWRDIAAYLKERDYAVYISEWHPIIRYGIPHDWRRIIPYTDQSEISADAWGNLLAFSDDPGIDRVRAAFAAMVIRRSDPGSAGASKASADQHSVTARRPFYAAFGERIRNGSPRLFALGQFMRRALAGVWRRRVMATTGAVLFGLLIVTGLAQPAGEGRLTIIGGAALLAILAPVFYLASWTYHRVRALSMETAALHAALARRDNEQAGRTTLLELRDGQQGIDRHIAALDADNRALSANVTTLRAQIEAAFSALEGQADGVHELGQLVAEMDEGLQSLEADLAAAQRAGVLNNDEIENLQRVYEELKNVMAARMT